MDKRPKFVVLLSFSLLIGAISFSLAFWRYMGIPGAFFLMSVVSIVFFACAFDSKVYSLYAPIGGALLLGSIATCLYWMQPNGGWSPLWMIAGSALLMHFVALRTLLKARRRSTAG